MRLNLRKPCVHSGRYSFDQIFMNLFQNVCHYEKKDKFESGSCWVKNRSMVQIIEKHIYTLEGTVLIQFALNFVKMFVTMKSQMYLKVGQKVGH